MRAPTRARIAMVAAIAAATALAGCSLFEQPGAIDYTQVQLNPTGNLGAWLDPGYADGVGEHWTVNGTACGAAGGVIAIADRGERTVTGYTATTGEEVWRAAETTCSDTNATGGHLLLPRWGADGVEYIDIDITTGAEQVFYHPRDTIAQAEAVGRTDDAIYLHLSLGDGGGALGAFTPDGTELWRTTVDWDHRCYLITSHIVCETHRNAHVVLDAATGAVTISGEELSATAKILWTTAGYTIIDLTESIGSGRSAIYDYSGAELGTVVGADLPVNPGLTEGVAYAVEDLSVEGAAFVQLTDAEGSVVAHWSDGVRLTATNLPIRAFMLSAGADGSTVLLSSYDDNNVELVAPDGAAIHTFEDVGLTGLEVLESRIVVMTRGGDAETTVYLPAG